ncbi:MAG: hypothetical protein HYU67_13630 [Flavobacteriia bacterium]|nr:hypothetical protein [Flavobacteriia bacterium]
MNRIFDFLERYKFGLLAVLIVYIFLFMYLQMETYEKWYVVPIWDERAELEKPQEIEIKAENIEVNQKASNDIKSISRDINDQSEKSLKEWSPNKSAKQIENEVKQLEKKMFEETGEAQKREKIKQEQNSQKDKTEKEKYQKNKNVQTNSSDKVYSGSVMVDWELKNRQPHLNNTWHVRNPGYTCGTGSNGRVFIKIKVTPSGNVSSAQFVPEKSQNVNDCMLTQAKKYALLSRFSYDSKEDKIQEGYIIYTFVSQNSN